jgi:hypothetical protein
MIPIDTADRVLARGMRPKRSTRVEWAARSAHRWGWRRSPRVARAALLALLLAAFAAGALTSAAWAGETEAFGIASFTTSSSSTQAGAHANFSASFSFDTDALNNPIDQIGYARMQLPAGLIGNPQNVPQCSDELFADFDCPPDSQVGLLIPSFEICRGVSTTLSPNGVVAPTTLAVAMHPGATTLTLATTAGIEAGDTLTIGTGPTSAEVIVNEVVSGTEVALLYGVYGRTYPEGTPVADNTIAVASTAGFCAGSSENVITIGSGASAQTAAIAYVTNATHLTLEEPLSGQPGAGAPVTYHAHPIPVPIPLYNLQPLPGHLGTLGASFLFGTFLMQVELPGDRLAATVNDLSTLLTVGGVGMTLWGVPGETAHNPERCEQIGFPCDISAGGSAAPFLTNPTNCGGAMTSTLTASSWQQPQQRVTETTTQAATTGCSQLRLAPTLTVTPETTRRDTPSGYEIDLNVPQNESPYGLASAVVRSAAIQLPAGTSLSPPGANGLQGCSPAQLAASDCPPASKVGSVTIVTPLVSQPLAGSVYLADPTPSQPFGILLSAAAETVRVQLAGQLQPDPNSGRLTIDFPELPELPFSQLRLNVFGGPSAALANPLACGSADTSSRLLAYGGQVAEPSSEFVVDGDGEGGACPAAQPFAPSFSAGTSSPVAGGFSPLTLAVGREDGQQQLSTITAQLPAGLLGMVSQVPPCPEPQAARGECDAAAQIGTVAVALGAGSQPLWLDGNVYLTGPYENAPFGLSIAVPAKVGPFALGTVVLRARILVNPETLQLSVSTAPLPQIVQGIPLRVRALQLTIDRPGFIFNPSDCASQTILATVASSEGASATLHTPYDPLACGELPFAPKLAATVHRSAAAGKDGAAVALHVDSTLGQASLREMSVQLPARLRARDGTLRGACPQATFAVAPADCPGTSLVGSATVATPVLSGPLSGPIYLVAGASPAAGSSTPAGLPGAAPAAPQTRLVLELHGQGLTVAVNGSVGVAKSGAATIRFAAVPDAPIEALTLDLPSGAHSLLGASHLCDGALALPFTLTAQNGRAVRHVARLRASGCAAPAPRHRSR